MSESDSSIEVVEVHQTVPNANQIVTMSQDRRDRLATDTAAKIDRYLQLLRGMTDGKDKSEIEEQVIKLYQLRALYKR